VSDQTNGHGGARDGAGRPKGRPSLRRAAQAVVEVEEAFPGWSPVLHLAAVANDETLPPEIRMEAAKAAAPYLHSRPKPVEMEPDALVDLERRLISAKIEAAAKTLDNTSLADRLARAKARIVLSDDDGSSGAVGLSFGTGFIQQGPADASLGEGAIIDATPSSPAGPSPRPLAEPSAPEAPRYVPILPTADPAPRTAADWSAPVPWSQPQAFADGGSSSFETDPYTDDPLGFLAGRS
jgi:hypothetical protein